MTTALPFPAPVFPLHRSLAGFRVVAYAHRAVLQIVPGLEALHQAHEDFFHRARTYLRDCDDLYLLVRGDEASAWRQAHVERTPAGLQHVLPGAGRDLAELARRRAAAPLKPAAPQAACDVGLFGDTHRQADLVDLARK